MIGVGVGLTAARRRRGGAAPGIITDGLVAEWRFDDGSGQVLTDYSGNGHHGQLGSTAGADANDPSWQSYGLLADGNDYVRINGHAALFALTTFHIFHVVYLDTATAGATHFRALWQSGVDINTSSQMLWRNDLANKALSVRTGNGTSQFNLPIHANYPGDDWALIEHWRSGGEHGGRLNGGTAVTGSVSGFPTGLNDFALFARFTAGGGSLNTPMVGGMGYDVIYNDKKSDEDATLIRNVIKAKMATRGVTLP